MSDLSEEFLKDLVAGEIRKPVKITRNSKKERVKKESVISFNLYSTNLIKNQCKIKLIIGEVYVDILGFNYEYLGKNEWKVVIKK